jgi:hypothetical protein
VAGIGLGERDQGWTATAGQVSKGLDQVQGNIGLDQVQRSRGLYHYRGAGAASGTRDQGLYHVQGSMGCIRYKGPGVVPCTLHGLHQLQENRGLYRGEGAVSGYKGTGGCSRYWSQQLHQLQGNRLLDQEGSRGWIRYKIVVGRIGSRRSKGSRSWTRYCIWKQWAGSGTGNRG